MTFWFPKWKSLKALKRSLIGANEVITSFKRPCLVISGLWDCRIGFWASRHTLLAQDGQKWIRGADAAEMGATKQTTLQGGPLPVISRVITPLTGVITRVTHWCSGHSIDIYRMGSTCQRNVHPWPSLITQMEVIELLKSWVHIKNGDVTPVNGLVNG